MDFTFGSLGRAFFELDQALQKTDLPWAAVCGGGYTSPWTPKEQGDVMVPVKQEGSFS
jgi:hypothetical protein